MLVLAVTAIGSYLLGSIPAGYLAGRIAGIDIRKTGSGNIGATNVTRVLGKRYGYPVFLIDFLKGFAAVRMSILISERHLTPTWLELVGILAAVCCVIGHSFPVWLHFRGGKGVATSAGALFALMPFVLLIGAVIWVVTFQLTRYVSVASITATVALPIVIWIMISLGKGQHGTTMLYFSVCLAAVVILRHRSNLSRLLRGTEPRFKSK